MKPSLLKHAGCDIIDINPGAGIWSSAIHNLLKPRNHYLMEPDSVLYTPLLQPLLDAEGSTYKLIPKSGAVWGHLNTLLTPETLPQQKEYAPGDPELDKPNDTLLVMANLGWHPRKPFRAFPSISLLVVHQLLSAVRAHSLFHQYGLIRMLIWVADEEGKTVLPRTINVRRKTAIEAEVSCSDIFEIASASVENQFRRDEHLNIESSRRALQRMEEAGITTPAGRETSYQLKAAESPDKQTSGEDSEVRRDWQDEIQDLEKRFAAGEFAIFAESETSVLNPEWKRLCYLRKLQEDRNKTPGKRKLLAKLVEELEALEAKFAAGNIKRHILAETKASENGRGKVQKHTPEYHRLLSLRSRKASDLGRGERSNPLFEEFEAILEMQAKVKTLSGTKAEELQQEIEERTAGFNEQVESLAFGEKAAFRLRLDDRRTFNNDPPLLYWDRREAEPLKVHAHEFYPKQELCLLDFHPQALWPVLRQGFPATYDIFEYLVSTMYISPTQSLKAALTATYPGAIEWLVEECPSLTDVRKGGSPDLDFITVRCLTLEMLREIIEAWMRWPFRPDRFELMRRSGSTPHDPEEDERLGSSVGT